MSVDISPRWPRDLQIHWEDEDDAGSVLNLANANFFHLWNVLGFTDPDYCGSVDRDELLTRMVALEARLTHQPGEWGRSGSVVRVRAASLHKVIAHDPRTGAIATDPDLAPDEPGITVHNMPLPEERLHRYLECLLDVIVRAEELGVDIQWA